MENKVAHRHEGPRNPQTHTEAHKKVLQLHEGLTKRESALLVQLRTEKIGFNDFLFTRRVPGITSPRCDCGARRQTVAHILLQCSKHRNLRNSIFANLSGRDNIRAILSTPQLATKAIQYIEQTQILGQNGDRSYVDDSQALGGD